MRKKAIIIGLLGAMYTMAVRCTYDHLEPMAEGKYQIRLRWVKAYEGEEQSQVMTGLQWSLSFLGASLPVANWPRAVEFIDDRYFVLDLQEVGFSKDALEAFSVVVSRLKESEEYQRFGAIDSGRFLVLSLHSSWHYYQITGAPTTLDHYLLGKEPFALDSFPILTSSIAKKTRMIRFQLADQAGSTFFIAEEAEDVSLPSYSIDHFEVLDILPNGQLRFLLYDQEGKLSAAAPISTTLAGKPSKCLWCHEINVQPLFQQTPDIPGFMNSSDFQLLVDSTNRMLTAYREGLPTAIDFDDKQAHTQSELLYITFMEPSIERIANEWEIPIDQARTIFKDFATHTYSEFPFLGNLYFRQWVDSLAPYRSERAPDSVREAGWEPDFF